MDNSRKEMIQNQFRDHMMTEELCAEMIQCDTPEKFCQLLNDNGVGVTVDEVLELSNDGISSINAYVPNETGELNEESLEDVTGGGKFLRGVVAVSGAAVCGGALGALCGLGALPVASAYTAGKITGVVIGLWAAAR